MPTDLTNGIFGSDSGELITASITRGIPHPPGYSTWLVASRAFAQLPLGRTLAHRYNIFSALCMSLAMLALAHACRIKCVNSSDRSRWLPSLAAVLTVAFTLTVWSQAVITEVYALNALMVCLTIFLLAKIDSDDFVWWLPALAGLSAGIAATTHLTSVFLGLVALIVFCNPLGSQRPQGVFANTSLFGAGFAIGLAPLLLLFWRAGNSSPIMWGDTGTLSGWWWLVSGAVYRPNVFAVPTAEIIERLASFFRLSQLKPALLIPAGGLVGLGLFGLDLPAKRRAEMLFPAGLVLTAGLYAVYAFSYNTGDWPVFMLPASLCLAVPLAFTLAQFKWWSLLLPLLMIIVNGPILLNARTDDTRTQANQLFAQAPANAILLTDGRDSTIFPMWYFRYAENQRPDTLVVDQNLFAFDWYRQNLIAQNPGLLAAEVDDLAAFRQQNSAVRPVCEVSLHPFALTCSDR